MYTICITSIFKKAHGKATFQSHLRPFKVLTPSLIPDLIDFRMLWSSNPNLILSRPPLRRGTFKKEGSAVQPQLTEGGSRWTTRRRYTCGIVVVAPPGPPRQSHRQQPVPRSIAGSGARRRRRGGHRRMVEARTTARITHCETSMLGCAFLVSLGKWSPSEC